MSLERHIIEHSALGVPKKDSDGNIPAQIIPRTGILASLLAVSNAGDGELATPTDVDGVVQYKGSPSVGTLLSSPHGLVKSENGRTAFSVIGTGDSLISISTAYEDNGLIGVADNKIYVPPKLQSSKTQFISLKYDFIFNIGSNTYAELSIYGSDASDVQTRIPSTAVQSAVVQDVATTPVHMVGEISIQLDNVLGERSLTMMMKSELGSLIIQESLFQVSVYEL